jgi:hypothetical protein
VDAYDSWTVWRTDSRPWVGTEDITLSIPDMVFFAWTGEDFDGCNRTTSNIQWFRQVLPAGPQIDLLGKEIPRYCKKQTCKPGEIWEITLVPTGFHFADVYGDEKIVRPVGFTPAFQQNAGWDDNLTTNLPRCILVAEKTAHSVLIPDDTTIVHAFSDGDFFRHDLGIQHTYLRAEEATLGISFNSQSQAPDIPNISSHTAMKEYNLSLNATQNDPDISRLPLRGLKQELSVSLNTQFQAPDDTFHAQDSSRAPRDSLYNSPFINQVFQMLPTRFFTAPSLPQTVSQDLTHLPPSRIQKTSYQGFWSSEVHVLRRLRIRFVRQDLVCVYGDVCGCCFLIWVCFFNDSRWSIIHTFLFVSFA